MITSISNYSIDLKNKYSLKAFFIQNKLNYNNLHQLKSNIVVHINNQSLFDTLYLNADSITFHLKINDTTWYKVICGHNANTITNVSEYLRSYSEYEDCWTELYDYENNSKVNEYRSNIMKLVKQCFNNIKTLYKSTDSDMISSPWFYNVMKLFEQTMSIKTSKYVKNYIGYIRRQLFYKQYYCFNLQRKMLCSWREWYYNPNNENGYMKKLASIYPTNTVL